MSIRTEAIIIDAQDGARSTLIEQLIMETIRKFRVVHSPTTSTAATLPIEDADGSLHPAAAEVFIAPFVVMIPAAAVAASQVRARR